jgi:hypothetical protein
VNLYLKVTSYVVLTGVYNSVLYRSDLCGWCNSGNTKVLYPVPSARVGYTCPIHLTVYFILWYANLVFLIIDSMFLIFCRC